MCWRSRCGWPRTPGLLGTGVVVVVSSLPCLVALACLPPCALAGVSITPRDERCVGEVAGWLVGWHPLVDSPSVHLLIQQGLLIYLSLHLVEAMVPVLKFKIVARLIFTDQIA